MATRITDTTAPVVLTPTNGSELTRNKWILGLGVVALGGLIGFLVSIYKGTKGKGTASSAIGNSVISAFEGAVIGLILAVAAIWGYSAIMHGKTIYDRKTIAPGSVVVPAERTVATVRTE